MYFWSNLKEDVSRFLRVHYNWFFPAIVLIVLQIVLNFLDIEKHIDFNDLDHNAILTINLTMAGFLLTALSIMIGVSDKEFVKILTETGHWNKIRRSVLLGLLFHILSSLLALINLIFITDNYIVFNLEISTFLVGMTYFCLTVFWLKEVFKYI